MDWGCCDQPNLQWNFMGETADLRCEVCKMSWTPVNLERPIHTEAPSSNGVNPLDDGTYQAAWKTLLTRIGEKTSWGKNLLRDVMLDVLTNPDPAEYPTGHSMDGVVDLAVEVFSDPSDVGGTTTVIDDSIHATGTVEESLAGVYPFSPDQSETHPE